jgi:hypothetical protein
MTWAIGATLRRRVGALARLLAPWRTIHRLEATVQRLEHVLADPMVAGIEIGKEKALKVGMTGSGPELLAGMFLGLMEEKGKDAPNYLELSFNSPRGRILVTVTQPNGATPHELRSQAEQRVRQLESELRRLQGDLKAGA